MMTRPDYDRTLTGIKTAIDSVRRRGLEPSRLYMNSRTYSSLIGVFHQRVIVMIPEGYRRTPTVCGVRVAVSDDLQDEQVDVSVKTI